MKKTSIVKVLRRNAGFSLIELLVVIVIIVGLIAMLIPAVAKAREQAYKTATEALMTGVDAAIRKYSQDFNGALPGIYPTYSTNATGVPIASSTACTVGISNPVSAGMNKISGTQNLMISLAYTFSGSAASGSRYVMPPGNNSFSTAGNPNAVTFSGGPALSIDTTLANGPMDFTVTTTPTNNKQYTPYYSPTFNDLKTCANSFKLTSIGTAWNIPIGSVGPNAFPVIVDRFSDPLPILYFRRDAAAGDWVDNDRGAGYASYYRQENSEYLDGIVYSTNNVGYDQGKKSSYSATASGASPATASTNMVLAIQNGIGGGNNQTYTSRGDYVLIGAGPDRIYGVAQGSQVSDDQVHVSSK